MTTPLKIEPDPDKAEELAVRLKNILDSAMLRDPSENKKEMEEAAALRKELEEMGLYVTLKYRLIISPEAVLGFKVDTEVNLWIPKNTTIQ